MKKIIATLAALFVALMLMAGPATAKGNDDQPAENKDVTLCHYKGNNGANGGVYTKITVDINGFLNGHYDNDSERDVWEAFSYTTKGGEVVDIAANPNAEYAKTFIENDCTIPKVDEKIAKPEPTYTDVCGVKDDVDLAVADDRGYTVGELIKDGNKQSITVTADNGFVFTDGSKSVTFTHTFSDESPEYCDLPETGGAAEYNTTLGLLALAGVGVLGGAFLFTRRRRS